MRYKPSTECKGDIFMKRLIIFLGLFYSLSLFAETDMTKVICTYHNDPNNNALMLLTFSKNESGRLTAKLLKNLSKDLNDEGPFETLFNSEVTVSEVQSAIQVKGVNLKLRISLQVAPWSKGSPNSKLSLPSAGIHETFICERSDLR